MCEVGTEVAWVKNDLKNIKVMRQYDKEHLKWWFSSEYYSVTLSDKWAWAVERGLRPNGAETWRWFDGIGGYMFHDKKVGQSIKSTRNEALNSLKIRLDQPIINSSSEFQKQPSIGTNFFTIYSPQKPTLKSNSIISPQQQEKQNKLTKALLIGDIELVKTLENQGASFSCPDHDGCYPLVAAVYGCNLELVKYIEAILQTEALEQWEKVDVHHFSNILQSQMPSVLPQNPTHGELGRWYEEFKDASWCPFYDREILKKMDCTRWTGNGSWSMEVRAPWLLKGHVWEYMTDMKISGKWGHGQDGDPRVESSEYFRGMLHCPSIKIHEEVVKAIQEQLSDLENYIHIKAGNHSNIKNKF